MSDTSISVLIVAGIAAIIFGVVYFIKKHKEKKRKQPVKRKPQRLDSTSRSQPIRLDTSVGTTSVARKPHAIDEYEYLTYRNCPECHSENTRASHVIYKIGNHDYVCHACGSRFKF